MNQGKVGLSVTKRGLHEDKLPDIPANCDYLQPHAGLTHFG